MYLFIYLSWLSPFIGLLWLFKIIPWEYGPQVHGVYTAVYFADTLTRYCTKVRKGL